MSQTESLYLVQFVGFKTALAPETFIQRWKPFATAFKRSGILTIDLFQVEESNTFDFMSRNVWEAKNYWNTFPSGIAG